MSKHFNKVIIKTFLKKLSLVVCISLGFMIFSGFMELTNLNLNFCFGFLWWICIVTLFFFRASYFTWWLVIFSTLWFQLFLLDRSLNSSYFVFAFTTVTLGLLCFYFIRFCVSFLLFKIMKKYKFKVSSTEKEALFTGKSWVEKEFFTGQPCFKKLLKEPLPRLNEEEKGFLSQELEELCHLSKEWNLMRQKQLSPDTEQFLKTKKFFGLSLPKLHKGREFSPYAVAKVVEKLSSYNVPLSIITMVPNSLGPAKLLLKYGTNEQKNKYLTRLALAYEIPCFALTEERAGSDAASIKSTGVLFKQDGHLKIRLNWDKRWITLSPKATLIALAVQLKDPENLYSHKKSLGITCVLVSSQAKGVKRGLYHDPMGIPIYNAPIKGEDVVVFAEEAIIGGLKQAGKGWKMIVETLSVGRGLSMPALSSGFAKKISWLTGTHSFIRKQFGLPIGKFEGVQEALGSIAGLTHLITATQTLTLSGLQQGIHSPVVTALTKYNLTEIIQQIAKKGMDVMGGTGLSLGPKNKIAILYMSLPLAITVEGANILTRTFIVYGQGLIKTHPYIYNIIHALEDNSFKNFHSGFWAYFYQGLCNGIRALVFSLGGAWIFMYSPPFSREHRAVRKIAWVSSLFGFLSDLNIVVLGRKLKSKGQLTGRFSDLLSYQYMALALIWYWKQTGSSKDVWIKTKWGLEYCFSNIQASLLEILNNYPHFAIRLLLKPLLYLLRINPIGQAPSDILNKKLATELLENERFKKELCSNMYFPKDPEDQFQKLEKAYKLSLKENKIMKKIKNPNLAEKICLKTACKQGLISVEEYDVLQEARKAQKEALQVDAFTEQKYFNHLL